MKQISLELCWYAHECVGGRIREVWGDIERAQESVVNAVMNCTRAQKGHNFLCAHLEFFAEWFNWTQYQLVRFSLEERCPDLLSELDSLVDLNRVFDTIRQRREWRQNITHDGVLKLQWNWEFIMEKIGISEQHILYWLFESLIKILENFTLQKSLTEEQDKLFESQIWAAQSIIGVLMQQLFDKIEQV